MIFFVGEIEKGYFVEEVASSLNMQCFFSGSVGHLANVKDKIVKGTYEHIVVDCEQLIDDYSVIANDLQGIATVTNANIIICAIGYSAKSELVQELYKSGFRNFIIATSLSAQKEQTNNCIQNINYIFDDNIIIDSEQKSEQQLNTTKLVKPQKNITKISFAGSCLRIGTTTQALQFIKYLQYLGFKACYIEENGNGFVQNLINYFEYQNIDEELGKVTYENVDLFYKPENISQILKQDYDYFIYDYGTCSENRFNAFSFAEKDIKIVVCGSKANEILSTNKAIDIMYKKDVFYIFSFCHESEKNDILELMVKKQDKTLFANYSPDPFTYSSSSNSIYSKIIAPKAKTTVKKKKGFFRR